MKSLYDFIVKPLGDTYENKKTIGDKELILNTKIESFKFVNNVAEKNVYMTIANIRAQSPVLEEMEKQGEIKIIGAMYDIKDGSVTFYE